MLQVQKGPGLSVRHSPYTKGNLRFIHVLYKYFLGNQRLLFDLVVILKNTQMQKVSTKKSSNNFIFRIFVVAIFTLKIHLFYLKMVPYTKQLFFWEF